MDNATFDFFFDESIKDSFGDVLGQVNQNNSIHLNCTDGDIVPTNCTSQQLALLQWGSATVTQNPLISNINYTAPTNTMSEWGDYLIEFMTQAPEFAYYVDSTH